MDFYRAITTSPTIRWLFISFGLAGLPVSVHWWFHGHIFISSHTKLDFLTLMFGVSLANFFYLVFRYRQKKCLGRKFAAFLGGLIVAIFAFHIGEVSVDLSKHSSVLVVLSIIFSIIVGMAIAEADAFETDEY
ncbi:MAG: hypothetical protein AAF429_05050 [Pseudomonadota bacterium]